MASRSLDLLHPALRVKCLEWNNQCLLAGLHPLITCTGRIELEQLALFSQGREPLEAVNRKRLAAGMPPIKAEENRKVTWTLKSQHIIDPATGFCNAYDFCLTNKGKAYWDIKVSVDNDEIPDYEEAGLIALELGLEWGGRWKTPDYPHIQLLV